MTGKPDVQVAILSAKPAMNAFGSKTALAPKFGDAIIALYVVRRAEPVCVARLSVRPVESDASQVWLPSPSSPSSPSPNCAIVLVVSPARDEPIAFLM